jgi:hypothetical protein
MRASGVPCDTRGMAPSADLFGSDAPSGFLYHANFISPDDEAALVAEIGGITFDTFEMRGVVAKRRVAFFGASYDRGAARAFPPFLLRVRDAVAEWVDIDPGSFAMALINEYPPGAPIGWHRDAPQYDLVAGISLLSSCRMKFRPCVPPRTIATHSAPRRRQATQEVTLDARSAYLMTGDARSAYEHHIPAVSALRYSITFRTFRTGFRRSGHEASDGPA